MNQNPGGDENGGDKSDKLLLKLSGTLGAGLLVLELDWLPPNPSGGYLLGNPSINPSTMGLISICVLTIRGFSPDQNPSKIAISCADSCKTQSS